MNWDALAAIGEILGAIAVVATLGYLATQTRSLRSAATDTNRLTRASGVRIMSLEMAKDDVLRNSVAKSIGADAHYQRLASQFELSIDEAGRADAWNVYWFWLHWGQYKSMHESQDREELVHLINLFYRIGPGA